MPRVPLAWSLLLVLGCASGASGPGAGPGAGPSGEAGGAGEPPDSTPVNDPAGGPRATGDLDPTGRPGESRAALRPAAGVPAAAPYGGPEPCLRATKGESPVARACAEGGLGAAKVAMKDLVRRGRAAGLAFKCDDCHSDTTDYALLTADAQEKFRKLLAATAK
jgi:hypothetical protein